MLSLSMTMIDALKCELPAAEPRTAIFAILVAVLSSRADDVWRMTNSARSGSVTMRTGTFFLPSAAAMATPKSPYSAGFFELDASIVSASSMKMRARAGTRS